MGIARVRENVLAYLRTDRMCNVHRMWGMKRNRGRMAGRERRGRRDTGRLRANFHVRVLAAPPEGTLSIRVAKEIPSYIGSATLVDTFGATVMDLVAKGLNTSAG